MSNRIIHKGTAHTVRYDSEWKSFTVKPNTDKTGDYTRAYFTDDKQDALDTCSAMDAGARNATSDTAIAKQFDADTDTVENLMDRLGVPGLLDLISSLCDAKSEHIMARYSDRELAERWGNAQMKLDRVAAIIREYKLEG